MVYGGARIGLMGEVARAARSAGGRVVGVIPRHIAEHGLAYEDADELILTETIRERKAIMESRADGVVALPGGFGTLEELLEVITLKQLNRYNKAIVLLTVDSFYSPLVELFEHLYRTRFAREVYRSLYAVLESVDDTIAFLKSYSPKETGTKWDV